METRVGFIGLGIMGKPMARNLLKAGYPLSVYSRRRESVEALLKDGATGAASPREVAETTQVVMSIVTDTPDVQQVILGPDGVLAGMRPGTVVVDMSTISPTATREIAQAVEAKGGDLLDAPVSGGEGGAVAGTLSIMVGGKQQVFTRCLPLFEAMGANITHMGPAGRAR